MLTARLLRTASAPLLIALVFLAIAAWGVVDASQRNAFYENSERTIGTVVEFLCPKAKRSTCTVFIDAEIRGQRLKVEAKEDPSPSIKTGSTAEVAYNIDSKGKIDARLVESALRGQNVIPMILGVGGFLMFLFATYLSIVTSPEWRKHMRHEARKHRNAA